MSSQAASCNFMGYPFTVIFGQLFSNPLRTSLSLSHSAAACCSSAWIECSGPTLSLLYMSDMLYYPWLRPQVSHQRICLKLITVWGWPISTQVHMAMSDFCVESQVSHSRCIAKSSSFIPDAVNRILASCYFIEVRTNDYPKSNMNQTPRTQLDDRRLYLSVPPLSIQFNFRVKRYQLRRGYSQPWLYIAFKPSIAAPFPQVWTNKGCTILARAWWTVIRSLAENYITVGYTHRFI